MITGLSFKRTHLSALAALGLTTALLVVGAGVAPASAATPTSAELQQQTASSPQAADISPELIKQAFSELLSSDLPRTVTGEGGGEVTTFDLPEGLSLSFGTGVVTGESDEFTTYIGGGSDSRGMYVLLNQFDQGLVISGSGFALGAALCAIPAVGAVACLVVGAILTVAGAVLAANGGTCRNNRQLKIYVTNGIRSGGCV